MRIPVFILLAALPAAAQEGLNGLRDQLHRTRERVFPALVHILAQNSSRQRRRLRPAAKRRMRLSRSVTSAR